MTWTHSLVRCQMLPGVRPCDFQLHCNSACPRPLTLKTCCTCRLLAECDEGIDLISRPRFHHQLLPDNLFAEDWTAAGTLLRFPPQELQLLRQRGHNITTV